MRSSSEPHVKVRKYTVFVTLLALGLVCPSLVHAQVNQLRPGYFDREPKEAKRADKKLDFVHRLSSGYLGMATTADMISTVRGIDHPTMAYGENKIFLGSYPMVEKGWASFLGKRNAGGVVAANVFASAAVDWLGYRSSRKWGRPGTVAGIAMNVAKATINALAAGQNIENSAGLDMRVRQATGYKKGPISWLRH